MSNTQINPNYVDIASKKSAITPGSKGVPKIRTMTEDQMSAYKYQ